MRSFLRGKKGNEANGELGSAERGIDHGHTAAIAWISPFIAFLALEVIRAKLHPSPHKSTQVHQNIMIQPVSTVHVQRFTRLTWVNQDPLEGEAGTNSNCTQVHLTSPNIRCKIEIRIRNSKWLVPQTLANTSTG